jgi:hypothetical protein
LFVEEAREDDKDEDEDEDEEDDCATIHALN